MVVLGPGGGSIIQGCFTTILGEAKLKAKETEVHLKVFS